MTTINVSNLITKIQERINDTTSERDLHYYSKIIRQLKVNNVKYVFSFSDLPEAKKNLGELYYVADQETVYFVDFDSAIDYYSWQTLFSGAQTQISKMFIVSCTVGQSKIWKQEETFSTNWAEVKIINSSFGGAVIGLKKDGSLWTWGSNNCGQLGDGTTSSNFTPRRVIDSNVFCNVRDIGAHEASNFPSFFAIKCDGSLFGWGAGRYGLLGDGTTVGKCSPVREISSSTNWYKVCGGSLFVNALKTDGSLWGWGCSICGSLGDGTTVPKCSPVRERCSATNWCQIGVDLGVTSSAIKTDGSLWAWGSNSCGQLGDGTTVPKCSPIRERCSATDWCQVTGGSTQTFAIKTNGSLWSWGLNLCGMLGDGTTVNRCSPVREICSATNWCFVSSSFRPSAAIKTDGSLWSWTDWPELSNVFCNLFTPSCSPVRERECATNWKCVYISQCNQNAAAIRT